MYIFGSSLNVVGKYTKGDILYFKLYKCKIPIANLSSYYCQKLLLIISSLLPIKGKYFIDT
jgi:hypothetical protein